MTEAAGDRIYRVAILGCRGRGTAAARAYHQHPRCQVVGLCDLLPERLDQLGDEFGVLARYDDYAKMIVQEAPDIVAIPTGTEFHYPLAMGVLEHGVHIDVEKPLCQDLDEADRLIELAESKTARIAVHHQGRTGGSMRAIKAALDGGLIGEPRFLLGSGKGYYAGYGLMNIGTHMVNNMIGLAGHVQHVSATALTAGRQITPADVIPAAGGMGWVAGEHITANLTFAGNVTGVLLQHRLPKVDSTAYCLEIYGTQGRLFWRGSGAWHLPVPHEVPADEEACWRHLEDIIPEHYDTSGAATEADYNYADEYVRALDEGRDHLCSGGEGRHVMEVLMAILEAGARRRGVDLPQSDRRHPLTVWREEAGLEAPQDMPRPYHEWLAAEDHRLDR
ncbi:MAG TPA: Gfo/Idh/MocA family oxidoreductase [Candidatus Latescibacteria bacterium]|nr:Gfo/Idh/MocA family oxidoreductase [Candidatus Latescibacterota bacterium]HJP29442.1 Gfo/Idh/MocA family oxidoreductase [Candidatus Latescibacterota bacterium]